MNYDKSYDNVIDGVFFVDIYNRFSQALSQLAVAEHMHGNISY